MPPPCGTSPPFRRAWQIAARLHHRQPYGPHADYTAHLAAVVFEVLNALQHDDTLDPALALPCAALHDAVEDTAYTLADVAADFGPAVAGGVVHGGFDLASLDNGDLALAVDTRSVYRSALEWLGGPGAAAGVFDTDPEALPLLVA